MTSSVCRAESLDAEFVEMGELDGDAAEIVPDAAEDFFDLVVGFFRKGERGDFRGRVDAL